jgi:hypothetical protein
MASGSFNVDISWRCGFGWRYCKIYRKKRMFSVIPSWENYGRENSEKFWLITIKLHQFSLLLHLKTHFIIFTNKHLKLKPKSIRNDYWISFLSFWCCLNHERERLYVRWSLSLSSTKTIWYWFKLSSFWNFGCSNFNLFRFLILFILIELFSRKANFANDFRKSNWTDNA